MLQLTVDKQFYDDDDDVHINIVALWQGYRAPTGNDDRLLLNIIALNYSIITSTVFLFVVVCRWSYCLAT